MWLTAFGSQRHKRGFWHIFLSCLVVSLAEHCRSIQSNFLACHGCELDHVFVAASRTFQRIAQESIHRPRPVILTPGLTTLIQIHSPCPQRGCGSHPVGMVGIELGLELALLGRWERDGESHRFDCPADHIHRERTEREAALDQGRSRIGRHPLTPLMVIVFVALVLSTQDDRVVITRGLA